MVFGADGAVDVVEGVDVSVDVAYVVARMVVELGLVVFGIGFWPVVIIVDTTNAAMSSIINAAMKRIDAMALATYGL